MDSSSFHPLVRRWFDDAFEGPTDVQRQGWDAIAAGCDTLVAAPTGSGKTLAAFLWAINDLVERAAAGRLEDRVHVIYVSPLKALGNDIARNLQMPLQAVADLARAGTEGLPEIRAAVRSGDTPAAERRKQLTRPPHILITTPESLYILLTAEKSRSVLAGATTVIVDEIHAVADDKRGAHLSLSLERLDRLCGHKLQRIGLSATQKPIEDIAHMLVGAGRLDEEGRARATIVDTGHRRAMDLSVEIPDYVLGPAPALELQSAVYDRIAELVQSHRTTIVFVNTRRLVERAAHALSDRLGKDRVAAHHGSLSRETRLLAETGLKSGHYPVVVATASLELGIDVGHVDLVCHIGSPRALATLLQRVGRSGHFLGAVPKGIFFPLTRDDLVQCAAAVRAVRAGALDRIEIPIAPRDVLAQQITAAAAAEDFDVEELWDMVRSAWPYRDLARKDFDDILEMLAEGVASRQGRRGAHLHLDRIGNRVKGRRGARLAAMTSGGAIPDTADFDVLVEPEGIFVGRVNEDFAVESLAGDIFQLGNHSWRILRVEKSGIRVEDAGGLPPTIPFWFGESPGRTRELSEAVCELRREVADRIEDRVGIERWLVEECGVGADAAAQIRRYIAEGISVLGDVPTLDTVIAERFFDEAGGMQLVLHAPFGARVNRALGLSLRKRFCVSFDFELQAAATDDGVVLSLGQQHSFPLDSIFSLVRSDRFEEDLTQAALQSPMFTNRWRWNATRALALLRMQNGKKVPLQIQRMRAEDLLAAVFPEQLGCQDNRMGNIEPPDHPLVRETMDDCMLEAMNAPGLRRVLEDIERGAIRTLAVDSPAPSVFSHELLGANPWAFLDDAPLEERRARAVTLRRTDPDLARGIGALDAAAIQEVRRQAWPDARDADEIHDVLCSLAVLPADHSRNWEAGLRELERGGRAGRVYVGAGSAERCIGWAAAERIELLRPLWPALRVEPPLPRIALPSRLLDADGGLDEEGAALAVVRGWMDVVGPTTAQALATRLGLAGARVAAALARLESQGIVLQGTFTGTAAEGEVEWCERGLLARIHQLTLGRLRREIEPVSVADFVRFLLRWQHAHPSARLHGRDGVRAVIDQLGGLELPGPAWEAHILPTRIARYEPADLEQLCLAGEVAWARLSAATSEDGDAGAAGRRSGRRARPTRAAPLGFFLREDLEALLDTPAQAMAGLGAASDVARAIHDHLRRRGASFLADIARNVGKLPTEVEEGLWELVAAGLVAGDGVAGLRTLLAPEDKRRTRRVGHLRGLPGAKARPRALPVGRWSLLHPAVETTPAGTACGPVTADDSPEVAEHWARRMLARWGVVMRELAVRERRAPRWREVLWALRRMEARGEVRGGRFVAGLAGEQFASAEAVEALRGLRRRGTDEDIVLVHAADPLNLVGVLVPGARIPASSGHMIAWRGGTVLEVGELGHVRSRLQLLDR